MMKRNAYLMKEVNELYKKYPISKALTTRFADPINTQIYVQ